MTTHRRARVLPGQQPVGALTETEDRYEFQYLRSWLDRRDALPVSLTMPLRSEPYRSRGLHPFFENLLPEGWLLELSTARLKIGKDDAFGLLLATCRDCIGAVEILPDDHDHDDSASPGDPGDNGAMRSTRSPDHETDPRSAEPDREGGER